MTSRKGGRTPRSSLLGLSTPCSSLPQRSHPEACLELIVHGTAVDESNVVDQGPEQYPFSDQLAPTRRLH